MRESITIQKKPSLPLSADYDQLRALGMEYIRQLGSANWTDYNIHDPGVTLLEALCYALTDLGYRTALPVADLLAPHPATVPKPDPRRQAFFTAREILTVSPWTVADYRKLLIDLEGVKNAWLLCKSQCSCEEFDLYIHCKESRLSYHPPKNEDLAHHTLRIKGFYDALVEFEDDQTGDLNTGKMMQNFSFPLSGADRMANALLEMRFPSWQDVKCNKDLNRFRAKGRTIQSITVSSVAKVKGTAENINEDEFGRALRRPLYVDLSVQFAPINSETDAEAKMEMKDVPITVWFRPSEDLRNSDVRAALKQPALEAVINDKSTAGIVARYFEKLWKAEEVMQKVSATLHQNRNLCEDFCHINAVAIQEVGVCADMELTPDADIEQVLAQAYYLIDQYFSPDIKFYSLKELMDAGKPVDEIFEGPALENGFIDNNQLEVTQLKQELRTSDVINLLMDIPGVVAIRNLTLVRYNRDGVNIGAESWVLSIPAGHQPRFYAEASKFLVFKNNLPFLPDREELSDTLQVIRGRNRQTKLPVHENDLPVPEGTYYNLRDYFPVQHSLPLTYGVGVEGLPSHATAERKAQAKQLKAFLLFFEQLLVNYLEQLAHLSDLFATDAAVEQTYFSFLLSETDIRNGNALYVKRPPPNQNENELSAEGLQALLEDEDTYLDRKNRFLDHLMARFGEQFTDYALMLYSFTGSQERTKEKLIKDKSAFLKDVPVVFANRGQSFDYKNPAQVCSDENLAGLQKRIKTLLGIQPLRSYFRIITKLDKPTKKYEASWRLEDDRGAVLLTGSETFLEADKKAAEEKASQNIQLVLQHILSTDRYKMSGVAPSWRLLLTDSDANMIAESPGIFRIAAAADAQRDRIIRFAEMTIANQKVFLVEHLLLRPRHQPVKILQPLPADYKEEHSLLEVCVADNCQFCGEEDPYSFRLTVVMNGEGGLANAGINFRRFAEQTIRQEVPAHIGVKICWVPNKDASGIDLENFEKAWCEYLAELAKADPDPVLLYQKQTKLLRIFKALKSVYPAATLHDCADGNDDNRVFLNQTILGKRKKDKS